MMNNTTFRANMENAVNTANAECSMPTREPGIQDLLVRLGELTKENRGLSYRIRENLFGPIPTEGNSCESTISCAKDAIEDAIARVSEANDILCYVNDHM